ncbi:MAG: type II CRISPR RNA-guided endonuclease Cas9, partial [Bacteroidota bacterium]|nr:type II CRISPR RNA-guided endonuclease Cas9 [Bacteroidota bacterium]
MKKILGLDLGTNSIGWALIEQDFSEKKGNIIGMGSRIIPMDQGTLGDFERGNSVSQTKERTGFRSTRRLRERHLLRRARLHVVLQLMNFLPEHYAREIDFEHHYGQFKEDCEPKLPYLSDLPGEKAHFLFKRSFNEMVEDFSKNVSFLKDHQKVPYDWTIYYLRKKALSQKIEKEELAWILLNFNQKRGYYQLREENEEENKPDQLVEFLALKVVEVIDSGNKKGKDETWYKIVLENGWEYMKTSKIPLDWKGKTKEFIVTTWLNGDG